MKILTKFIKLFIIPIVLTFGVVSITATGGGGGGSDGDAGSDQGTANDIATETITIAASGGKYEVADLILDISENAIENDQTIKVSKYTENDGEIVDDSSITPVYSIEGLQNVLEGPITIKIPLFEDSSDDGSFSPFLLHVIEDGAESISAGTVNDLSLHEAQINNGYLVATLNSDISAPGIADSFNALQFEKATAQKSTLQWFGGKLEKTQLTANGDFKIFIPKDFIKADPKLDLIDNIVFAPLDASVSLLNDMGFKWTEIKRPIPVILANKLWTKGSYYVGDEYETYALMIFGSKLVPVPLYKEPRLIICKEILKEGEEYEWCKHQHMVGKIGHEFFHAIQVLYLSEPEYSDFKFYHEASSSWLEDKLMKEHCGTTYDYLLNPGYYHHCFFNYGLDDDMITDKVEGIWSYDSPECRTNTVNDLGYGASYFLGYLTKYLGDKVIFDLWNNIKSNKYKSGLEALDKAISDNASFDTPPDLEVAWEGFAMSYATGFGTGFWAGKGGASHSYKIGDNDGSFAFKMGSYSAVKVSLNPDSTPSLDDFITITFIPEQSAEQHITAQIYRKNEFAPDHVLSSKKESIILVNQKWDLVITNFGNHSGTKNVTLKIEGGASDLSCGWPMYPLPEYCKMSGTDNVCVDTNENENDDTCVACEYYGDEMGETARKLQYEIPYQNGQKHGRVKFYYNGILNDYNLYENGIMTDYCD